MLRLLRTSGVEFVVGFMDNYFNMKNGKDCKLILSELINSLNLVETCCR